MILIDNGGADSIASLIYLNELNLSMELKFAKNVFEMSPSGKSPVLRCGRYTIGEFEPIVNFCNLKVFIDYFLYRNILKHNFLLSLKKRDMVFYQII